MQVHCELAHTNTFHDHDIENRNTAARDNKYDQQKENTD